MGSKAIKSLRRREKYDLKVSRTILAVVLRTDHEDKGEAGRPGRKLLQKSRQEMMVTQTTVYLQRW